MVPFLGHPVEITRFPAQLTQKISNFGCFSGPTCPSILLAYMSNLGIAESAIREFRIPGLTAISTVSHCHITYSCDYMTNHRSHSLFIANDI